MHTGILSRNCQLRGWFRSQGASSGRSVGHTHNRRQPCTTGDTSSVLGPRSCESLVYNFHNGGTIFALNQPNVPQNRRKGRGRCAFSSPSLFANTVQLRRSHSFRSEDKLAGQVGVPGGIPNRTTIYQTISSSLGNGSTNAQPAINGAVNSCPDGQVIKLPDGVFLLNANVRPSPSNKGNFTIRGNGPGRTILKVNNGTAALYFGSADWPYRSTENSQAITSGATAGSSVMTVGSTSSFTVGNLVHVSQSDISLHDRQ